MHSGTCSLWAYTSVTEPVTVLHKFYYSHFFRKPHKLKCWADRWALTLTHVLSVSISDEYSQQNSDIEWDRRSK